MKVLASYAIKGGVGKTSAAVCLAHLAAESGLRTLLWDLDPQGSATYLLRVKPKVRGGARGLVTGSRELDEAIRASDHERLDLIPSDFRYRGLDLELDGLKKPTRRLRALLDPLAADYDLVVLDCAPSVSLVSESIVHATDLLVVPLVPAPLAARSYDQLVSFLEDLSGGGHDGRRVATPGVLPFWSMVDRRKTLHRELIATPPGPEFASTVVPSLAAVEAMASVRAPVTAYAPSGAAATAYRGLWREVARRLQLG
ncbi:MAG: ParA family protein [Kineosporiaceae bacterium]